MATLRCLPLAFSRTVISAVAALAVAGIIRADDSPQTQPPRAIMRLPRWIESLGEPPAKAKPRPVVAADATAGTASATDSSPLERGSPARVQTPAGQPIPRPSAAVAESATPRSPARTASGRLTAEWAEYTPVSAPSSSAPRTADNPETTTAPAGETGPLKKWLSDTVGAIPKPLAKPQASASEATDKPATDKPATDKPATAATTAETSGIDDQTTATEPASTPAGDKPAKTMVTAPVAAVPDEKPTLPIDPASFRGIHPGKTTADELRTGWGAGDAFSREDGSRGLFYKIEPFERVEVTVENDVVSAIRIKLAEPVAVGELARQLEIADLRTVSIIDEQGVSIGEVFPERGVILSVKPGTQSATAVMIEPLDAESFVLRAEGEIDSCAAYAVADLEYAVSIDPKHLRAHRLLMVLMAEQGRWHEAIELAEAAIAIDPSDVWTRMKLAGIQLALDRPEDARRTVESIQALPASVPIVGAQVERLLGRIDMAAETPDYQRAVDHFAEAIRRSSTLLTKRSPAVQHAAREILLDAHLGTALALAKGTWQQKARVIPKWMARSEAVVAECKADESVRQTLELQLCRGALAVAAGSVESFDAVPWVKRLLAVRERMSETVKDPWRSRQADWEVGLGLLDALSAAQIRGDATDMLDNATLTAAYLERGGEHRELTDEERRDTGDLLFRVGIMHSLQRGDHATAVTWFDRVIPMWEGNPRRDRDGGELGESYVSMAISYWQVNRRDDAMALSRRGVELMVAAVDSKQLEERSLAVAYGNLSTMYAEQGDETQAENYAEMASRAEASGSRLR